MKVSWIGSLSVSILVFLAVASETCLAEGTREKDTGASSSNSQDETTIKNSGEEQPIQSTTTEANDESATSEDTQRTARKKKRKIDDDFDVTNEDWGTYYDPQNVFCGKFDCYKILGFDYESYYKLKPTTKEITQRYRRLSREWHPDKSKHKQAKDRFVKIARAYEVLTNIATRKEYDSFRYDQAAYVSKYGSSVIWQYAPKTDFTIVVLIVLIVSNIASWYAQKHRWSMVAERLIKAAAEDWAPRDGGSPESKQLREEALAILAQRESEEDTNATDANVPESEAATSSGNPKALKKKMSSSGAAKAAKSKLTPKEKKKQENEAILPIVTDLVNAMDDFGGGFHKPTWKDLLIVGLAKMPYKLGVGVIWITNYYIRRLRKIPLSDEEKEFLTSRAVGPVIWNTASEDDRVDMIAKKLWITENLVEWNEEQEIKKLSPSEQKLYIKLKKKGKLDKFDKLE